MCSGQAERSWADAPSSPESASAPTNLEPPASKVPSWFSGLDFGAFADTYYSVTFGHYRPSAGANKLRGYDQSNGFALAFAGLNLAYKIDVVGAVLELRFGPGAQQLALDDNGIFLQNFKQAYASLQPIEGLEIDFGKFDQPYGAELTDSGLNYNYSRGALYWLAQPFFVTGIRAQYTAGPLSILGLLVNGWNRSVDNNAGKSAGVQLGYAAAALAVKLGYMTGPEQPDTALINDTLVQDPRANGRFRHFFDLLISSTPLANLVLVLNANLGADRIPGPSREERVLWYGVMAAGRYAVSERFGIALRGEFYREPEGFPTGAGDLTLFTGTLTLETLFGSHVSMKLEGRTDVSRKAIFPGNVENIRKMQPSVLLGVVAKTF